MSKNTAAKYVPKTEQEQIEVKKKRKNKKASKHAPTTVTVKKDTKNPYMSYRWYKWLINVWFFIINKKPEAEEVEEPVLIFSYFNKALLPETLEELMGSFLISAYVIMEEHEVDMRVWCTIRNYKNLTKNLWNNEDAVYFKRCHLDSLVDEFGYMLWNGIEDKIRMEWLRSGYLPEVEGVSKKFKKNGEYVSSLIADNELERFKDKFK